ncbi:hypothetical protein HK102_008965 [Quaeritorhiza haematococci]|nr:hypothetical protein HK102_008965 [Quaeritorhiza haematococci]
MTQLNEDEKQRCATTTANQDIQYGYFDAHLEFCRKHLTPQQILEMAGTGILHLRRMLYSYNETLATGCLPDELYPALDDFPTLLQCASALDSRFYSFDRNSPAALARDWPKPVTTDVSVRQRTTDRFLAKKCAHKSVRVRLDMARENGAICEMSPFLGRPMSTLGDHRSSGDNLRTGALLEPHENFQNVHAVEARKPYEKYVTSVRNRITGLRVDERGMSEGDPAVVTLAIEKRSKAKVGSYLKYRPILPSRLNECISADWPVEQKKQEKTTLVVDNKPANYFDKKDTKFNEDVKAMWLNTLPTVLPFEPVLLMGIIIETPPAAEYHPKDTMGMINIIIETPPAAEYHPNEQMVIIDVDTDQDFESPSNYSLSRMEDTPAAAQNINKIFSAIDRFTDKNSNSPDNLCSAWMDHGEMAPSLSSSISYQQFLPGQAEFRCLRKGKRLGCGTPFRR